jgi:hypothetical protein
MGFKLHKALVNPLSNVMYGISKEHRKAAEDGLNSVVGLGLYTDIGTADLCVGASIALAIRDVSRIEAFGSAHSGAFNRGWLGT